MMMLLRQRCEVENGSVRVRVPGGEVEQTEQGEGDDAGHGSGSLHVYTGGYNIVIDNLDSGLTM